MEIFARQTSEYQALVLPPGIPRVAIEAAAPMSWYKWVAGNGEVIGIERFGASAPYEKIYEGFGLTTGASRRDVAQRPRGSQVAGRRRVRATAIVQIR